MQMFFFWWGFSYMNFMRVLQLFWNAAATYFAELSVPGGNLQFYPRAFWYVPAKRTPCTTCQLPPYTLPCALNHSFNSRHALTSHLNLFTGN